MIEAIGTAAFMLMAAGAFVNAVQQRPALKDVFTDAFADCHGRQPPDRDRRRPRLTLWGVHDGLSWKNNYPAPGG